MQVSGLRQPAGKLGGQLRSFIFYRFRARCLNEEFGFFVADLLSSWLDRCSLLLTFRTCSTYSEEDRNQYRC